MVLYISHRVMQLTYFTYSILCHTYYRHPITLVGFVSFFVYSYRHWTVDWNVVLKTFLIIFTKSKVSRMLSAPFKIRLNVKLGHVGLHSPMNEKTPELKCFLCKAITSRWLHWPLTASTFTGLEKSLEMGLEDPLQVCVWCLHDTCELVE